MRYLTARKRAEGQGASGTGTGHHWYMTVSAAGLAVMVPTFVIIFGRALGRDHAGVLETFSHPFAAILAAMVLVVGLQHFWKGVQIMLEDYTRGITRKLSVVFVIAFSYFLMATGLFAIARIAL